MSACIIIVWFIFLLAAFMPNLTIEQLVKQPSMHALHYYYYYY